MTKKVRIENADTSNYRVVVEVWNRGYPEGAPDILRETRELHHAADLSDFFISAGTWLVVKELPGVQR